jgi:hypothetical protein
MGCFNRNTAEWQEINTKYKNPMVVDSLITKWQKTSNSDTIPSLFEVDQLLKNQKKYDKTLRREFKRSLLNDLSNRNLIDRVGKDSYRINDINEVRKLLDFRNISKEAYKVLEIKKPGSDISLAGTTLLDIDETKLSAKNYKYNIDNNTHVIDIIQHMQGMFPQLNITVVEENEAREYYDNLPEWQKAKVSFVNVNSYYVDDAVVLIKGRVTAATAIEEVLHPFVNAIEKDNSFLFKSLLAEAKENFPELREKIDRSYSNKRGFDSNKRNRELVTQALTDSFNKEYETEPTRGWKEKIADFIKFIAGAIKDLYAFISGKTLVLDVDSIRSNTNLTNLAKLLNTGDLQFNINPKILKSKQVQFSLTEDRERLVEILLERAENSAQRKVIERLTYASINHTRPFDNFTVQPTKDVTSPLVWMDEATHTYYDANDKNKTYDSVTYKMKGEMNDPENLYEVNRNLGNDFDDILVAVSLGKQFTDLPKMRVLSDVKAKKIFEYFEGSIEFLRAANIAVIPQVIIADEASKTAGTIDILLVYPDASLGIIDLKTSKNSIMTKSYDKTLWDVYEGSVLKEALPNGKISTSMQHSIQVNTYKRILENMGFVVRDKASTFHLWLAGFNPKTPSKFKLVTETPKYHNSQDNIKYVDLIVPDKINEELRDAIKEERRRGGIGVEPLTAEEARLDQDQMNNSTYAALNEQIKDYKVKLIKERNLFEMLTPNIRKVSQNQEIIQELNRTITMLSVAEEKGNADVAFEELLEKAIKHVAEMKRFISDPKEVPKRGFITKIRNFQKIAETYRGLAILKAKKRGGTEKISLPRHLYDLKEELQVSLNEMVGSNQNNPNEKFLIRDAIDNYVRTFVTNNTNNPKYDKQHANFSEVDLDNLMSLTQDIWDAEAMTGTAATSKDPILALMNKLWKSQKQKVLDQIDRKQARLKNVLTRMERLSPGGRINYDFMTSFDADGKYTGRTVQKIGYDYWKARYDLRGKMYDLDQRKEYIRRTNVADYTDKELAYNKKIYEDRQAYYNFMRSEKLVTINGVRKLVDGDFHKYSQEFKDARDKYEKFIPSTKGNYGYWQRRRGFSDTEYAAFRNKWFYEIEVDVAELDPITKEFTGHTTKRTKDIVKQSVNGEFVKEIKDVGDKFLPGTKIKDLRDKKYVEIMRASPSNELAQVQKEFYILYNELYNEMLDKLPQSIRDNMYGKGIVTKDRLLKKVEDEGPWFTSLWTKMTRGFADFVKTTGTSQKVLVDEHYQIIDTLPVFMVGNARTDEQLEAVEQKMQELTDMHNTLGKDGQPLIGAEEYQAKLDAYNADLLRLRAMPSKQELSLDHGANLLKFIQMAENYEIMGEIKDTLEAMVDVIKNRKYTSADGLTKWIYNDEGEKEVGGKPGEDSWLYWRAKKFMSMVYYENEETTRNVGHKILDKLQNLSSLTYVGWNKFGNINNYAMGRISNLIEVGGAKFFDRGAYWRSRKIFNSRVLQDIFHKLGDSSTWSEFTRGYGKYKDYIPLHKYQALVNYFRMMDAKSDIRELNKGTDTGRTRAEQVINWGYLINDGVEYNIQTNVGMAILLSKNLQKRDAQGNVLGEKSIYDAYQYNNKTGELKLEEGYEWYMDDKSRSLDVTKEGDQRIARKWSNDIRYEIRNYIREVNILMHGNYANEDKMVIQQWWWGRLLAQFHKWTVPLFKARIRPEYFDENLGYIEGRYNSVVNLLVHVYKTKNEMSVKAATKNYFTHPEKGKMRIANFFRTGTELSLLLGSMALAMILSSLFDDDSDKTKARIRLENALLYQLRRQSFELMFFIPVAGWSELYQMGKSPMAVTRTMGELGEAFEQTVISLYGFSRTKLDDNFNAKNSKYYYYQKGSRKGQSKLRKEWGDVIPLWYELNRLKNLDNEQNFFIR